MRIVADLHVHSRFSRACSKDLTLENNAKACAEKGVNLLGTGDCTHPIWFAEIEERLVEKEPGLYTLKPEYQPKEWVIDPAGVRFILTTEVSQIYKRGGKTRRIHNLIFAPSMEAVRKLNAWLDAHGYNRKSDGRPILGLDSEVLYRELKTLDSDFVLVPAHVWTPWFSVFGSKSGFDTLEECYGEMTKDVFAIETGLSSDPLMNRSWRALDRLALISNSDAHSPQNFGREANVFNVDEMKLSFAELMRVIHEHRRDEFLYTIEFFPEEGKYHVDGHAACAFTCSPEETERLGGRCPECGSAITVGVLSRIHTLANRNILTSLDEKFTPYKSIVPLPEVIAGVLGTKAKQGKKVLQVLDKMHRELGNDFYILLDASFQDIASVTDERVARAIARVRAGRVRIVPGYDGVYGIVDVVNDDAPKMMTLF